MLRMVPTLPETSECPPSQGAGARGTHQGRELMDRGLRGCPRGDHPRSSKARAITDQKSTEVSAVKATVALPAPAVLPQSLPEAPLECPWVTAALEAASTRLERRRPDRPVPPLGRLETVQLLPAPVSATESISAWTPKVTSHLQEFHPTHQAPPSQEN